MRGQHFFYVGLGVLLLALLVACGQVPIAEPETGQPAPAEVVAPQTEEQPLTIETEATTGSAFSAANPELMVAGRYPASVEEKPVTDSAYYAANPELMVARRYPAPVAEIEAVTGSAFYAANPELMTVRRHAATENLTLDDLLEANPELRFARRRLATAMEKSVDSTFLAANPELMVAHRYRTMVELRGD